MAITKIQSESLNLADNYDFTGTVTGAGESNVPAFRAWKSSDQIPSAQTQTLITFDSETFDTNNAFASNTFTVPSGEAGKYYINANINIDGAADGYKYYMYLLKNGTSYIGRGNVIQGADGEVFMNTSTIIDASVGDAFTVTVWLEQSQVVNGNQLGHTYFEGFKISS